MPVQPSAQHGLAPKRSGPARQIGKDNLRNIVRQVGRTVHQARRRRINEVNVAGYQFAKGGFRAGPGIIREQCLALRHLISLL